MSGIKFKIPNFPVDILIKVKEKLIYKKKFVQKYSGY